MAITTLDGAIAGMQPPLSFYKAGATMEAAGVAHSLFYTNGTPGAAAAPTTLNGTALTAIAGQIPFTNPGGGVNTYLARLEVESTQPGTLWLCDRLWHNGTIGITTTTGQSITFPGLPARDKNGSSNGVDVQIALEVSATCGNAAITNTTITYTDSANGSPNTGTIPSVSATAVAGSFFPFTLAAGDDGVRSVQTLTLGTTYASGTVHLVAYRVLAKMGCMLANVGQSIDLLTAGFPRLYDNTCPFLVWVPTATTAATISGQVIYCQG